MPRPGHLGDRRGGGPERFTLTADRASQVLTPVSMEHNVKVRDVAVQFVTTGELPAL